MTVRDKITVLTTKNIDETIIVIKEIQKKLEKGISVASSNTLADSMKVHKKANFDKKTFFIASISCLPGVSSLIAGELYLQFETITNFINQIQLQDNKESFIQNIQINTQSGKKRKLGKVGLTILEYFGA